jgi:hypothetical protein
LGPGISLALQPRANAQSANVLALDLDNSRARPRVGELLEAVFRHADIGEQPAIEPL